MMEIGQPLPPMLFSCGFSLWLVPCCTQTSIRNHGELTVPDAGTDCAGRPKYVDPRRDVAEKF